MDAFKQIVEHIENKKSFVLEAGAGSGKTYTLIQTLNYLIENKGKDIRFNHQRIICITYTNVAKNEIIERLEHNPLVLVSTIHEFLWDCIKPYQKQLKIELCKLNEIHYSERILKKATLKGAQLAKFEIKYIANLSERILNIEEIKYEDPAFQDFEKGLLHHDDIIILAKMMFVNNILLTNILAQKYPFLLVDEYQDTAKETVISLIDFLLERNKGRIILGFFGDSHQKIYDSGIGDLEKYFDLENEAGKKLELVKKEENYRSSIEVIRLLNNFRKNIKQEPQTKLKGSVKFIYCRNYPKKEIKGINDRVKDEGVTEYEKRIEPYKNKNYDKVLTKLKENKWNFDDDSDDKILIITNSRVAKRAKFEALYQIFSKRYGQRTKDQLLDRNHSFIKYLVGYIDKKTSQEREVGIEHLIYFWKIKNYNEVFRFLKKNSSFFNGNILKHSHKILITKIIEELIEVRKTKTVKEVFDFIEQKSVLLKSSGLNKLLERVSVDLTTLEDDNEDKKRTERDKEFVDDFMNLPYLEIINFFEHKKNNTVFSTKHSTKGEEYRNVLTVIDDTEFKTDYNFQNFFNDTEEKEDRKIRTKNLFYVECSRAKENLIVLALSEMCDSALNNIKSWFGDENVIDIENL
ncbi:ATP-dependent helicase [Flavobacterium psychroterrae]|uniref:ATP-dependent helicase n=1 Tax=Flavobacterium psychroterrae TaxID=2133767 RepID=A0ABS5PAY0_9FLAO|nr:ATP-dependent helicase [Flavobacterium psychroterrae]MBS7231472.1 ATP-dependent helicase [Flavobacterium psychroterrae]